MELPEIPHSYLIFVLLLSMVIMRFYSIDSFTTAALSAITGYLLGVKLEQTRTAEIMNETNI